MDEDRSAGYTGFVDAAHKWKLPGVLNCLACKATLGAGFAYPCVDLTPVAALADFEKARPEPIEEYERLCELVRPLLPPGALLEPGSTFGPLVGNGQGRFGQLVSPSPWWLLVGREAMEKLQAEGLRGFEVCRAGLRFRQRNAPELLDLEILPMGRLHRECLPPDYQPPCSRCGRSFTPLPDDLLLDVTTLPKDLDLFRLEDLARWMQGDFSARFPLLLPAARCAESHCSSSLTPFRRPRRLPPSRNQDSKSTAPAGSTSGRGQGSAPFYWRVTVEAGAGAQRQPATSQTLPVPT
ncbi:double-CXXCG motif protein [Archangium sp.]|uniref:SitI6 family double-CXXCG motif immunity protein n=1 Tax=Archangium sp. TaxID=1872627 RepID=UPI002D6BFB80|nr:double-CXXCG motif protein [Archangium sp.]HYO58056.1 double-CXXCG motif protein [Archangium sp.]